MMFVFKAFWAVALLLIAVNAVSVATAQAGGSKRELIGDEYKGLLQAMDHKVSTARRLLKDVGATQGERTRQILDSIEDGMGGAVLTKHNGAHDNQIDGIVRVLMEAEHMGMYPPSYGGRHMMEAGHGMYPPSYMGRNLMEAGMYPPSYGTYM
ncbi:hypothetical protein HC023_27950 [Streptomyces sp. NEAU-H3]|nr:hypothetical protein [Streptomyces sp. NEAU-H3]